MKYWSIWDDQILRALRGAFSSLSTELIIVPGFEGGAALWLHGDLAGHWVATGRETFAFLPLNPALRPRNDVVLLDIIDATDHLLCGVLRSRVAVPNARSATAYYNHRALSN